VGDAVITALNDRDRAVRQAAMEALGAMRFERAVQALTDLFQYFGKGNLAAGALDAIAHIAHASSVPVLAAQLMSNDAALKTIAIEGLARAGDTSKYADIQASAGGDRSDMVLLAGNFASATLAGGSLDPLAEALTRARLHDQAQQYLTELAPGRSRDYRQFLQDPDARIRASVLDALALSYDAAALPVVEALLMDKDPLVARAAERAAARLRAISN
jgi:HEAT repeat protein